jgi:hypothetical protein
VWLTRVAWPFSNAKLAKLVLGIAEGDTRGSDTDVTEPMSRRPAVSWPRHIFGVPNPCLDPDQCASLRLLIIDNTVDYMEPDNATLRGRKCIIKQR